MSAHQSCKECGRLLAPLPSGEMPFHRTPAVAPAHCDRAGSVPLTGRDARWCEGGMPVENWRPVVGYEGLYEVSDLGRIRSLPRTYTIAFGRYAGITRVNTAKILSSHPNGTGHLHIGLWANGERKLRSVHRLVLLAFVGPAPEGTECCHNNGDPSDNRLENLRWDTKVANAQDTIRHGNNPKLRQTHCPNGHPFDESNTRIVAKPNGKQQRVCRRCINESSRAYRQKTGQRI